jgi:hypothetical protein
MSNRVIAISVTLASGYAALSATALVADVEITSISTNADAYILGSDGTTHVIWKAGQTHTFVGVDLASIQMKGTAGNVVTIIGNQSLHNK